MEDDHPVWRYENTTMSAKPGQSEVFSRQAQESSHTMQSLSLIFQQEILLSPKLAVLPQLVY